MFGAAFAWVEVDGVDPHAFRRGLRRYNWAYLLGWLPVGVYLLVRYFSWSWWYLLTEEDFPVLLTILPLTFEYLAGVGAYTLVALALERYDRTTAVAIPVLLVSLLVAATIVPLPRILWMGSYAEFVAGKAPFLVGSVAKFLEWTAIAVLIGAVYGTLWAQGLRERRARAV